MAVLARTAERLLLEGLPPAAVDGKAGRRPTLLPLPNEVPPLGNLGIRLNRIASFGSSLCAAPPVLGKARHASLGPQPPFMTPERADPPEREPTGPRAAESIDAEARLFFDYLRGDFPAASLDLDAVDRLIDSPAERLALLSLRAQILWSKGDHADALATIAYLVSSEGRCDRRIEDTPLGPVITQELSPRQAWARYLATKAEHAAGLAGEPIDAQPAGIAAPRLRDPFDDVNLRMIERREEGFPFAPPAPGILDRVGEPGPPPVIREVPADAQPRIRP